jgi:predicted permease
MRWIADGWRQIRALTRLASLERGLDEEIRFHLDRQTEKHRRAGLPADEARRQALLRFGAIDRAREGSRDQFRPVRVDDLLRDLRYTVRGLRRSPGFTTTALVTLALGIGATTAVFSVVYAVLIKPLPYPHAETIVSLEHTTAGRAAQDGRIQEFSASLYFTYLDKNRTLQALGLWSTGTASVTGSANPEEVRALRVSDGMLQTLDVRPMIGRWFSKEEMSDEIRTGPGGTAMLTFGYWQRRYGGDATVIGRRITVNARPRTIVGVMPDKFRFLDYDVDLILPDQPDRKKLHLGGFAYRGLGRLRPGVTVAQANADFARLVPVWLNEWPAPPGLDRQLFAGMHLTPSLVPLSQAIAGNVSEVLWVLLATIGLVLLIACANVANLLLVRIEGRQHELAIRAALGAGRRRIARECVVESLVLALAGGVLGLGLAFAALRLLVLIGPASLPRLGDIAIDPTVVGFTLIVSIGSGLLFGIIPVFRHGAPQVGPALRGSGRGSSSSRERHRTRNTLVVLQVALALVLLVASGLMVRTFIALRAVQPGFTAPEHVQLVRVAIPETLVEDPERALRDLAAMRDRLAAIPGVAAVSFADAAPLEDGANEATFVENAPSGETVKAPIRRLKLVAPGLLAAVGTPIVTGRDLTWDDIYQHRPVVMVSEKFAREYWRTPEAALGKRIRENPTSPWREIVGVAADIHDDGMQRPAPAIVYWPVLMENFWGNRINVPRAVTFAIRSSRTGNAGFLEDVQQAIWAVNRSVPLARVSTLGDLYDRSMAQASFALVMLAIAGTMALVLGVVGIYGVIAYAVTQRRREIGIRVALGAERGALKRMFVRQGLALAGLGIVFGLTAALIVSRVMSFLLFGISPLDPATYLAGSVVLLSAAALASYIPALQTTSVDPIEALRAE